MVAETISLGILSLPAAISGLGVAPGIIVLIGLGIVASYTGYILGQFKLRHPHVSSIADAGEVILGPFGREIFFTGHMLYLVFIMSSHILTFTVAMNTITEHGTCSLVFGVVGTVISFFFALPRTMKNMTWFSLACECLIHVDVTDYLLVLN
jgi:amino acid permease